MMKLSVCLETVLPELDFYDRIEAAAALGFDAVEFWEVESKDISKVAALASKHKVPVSICCARDVRTVKMNGPSAVIVKNIRESIAIIKEMGCDSMIVLAGDIEGRADSQKNIITENLKRVADMAVRENVTINIEALNSLVDHKGYYLDSSAVAFEIIKSVDCENIKFLYDIYHLQIMEGNIIENITKNTGLIGHIHSAGVPGRHEPFLGENNYKYICGEIEKSGYNRYFGLEYYPSYDSMKSLQDVKRYFLGE